MWIKCITFFAGVMISAVIMGCEIYKRRQNQSAISQGPRHNVQEENMLICGICLKILKQSEAIFLPCKHTFCLTCLKPLLSGTQTSCCDCRMEIAPDDLLMLKSRVPKLQ